MKKLYAPVFLVLFAILNNFAVSAQSVINPDDSLITYNPSNPPATPPSGVMSKWVRTVRMNWNTSAWKAYYYNGTAFRVLFPTSYKTNPTKTYPLLVFFHGAGEPGTIYDNELQLANCAKKIQSEVQNGTFDGFVLFPQSQNKSWFNGPLTTVQGIVNYMIANNRVDKFRIVAAGLSGGGEATWSFISLFPKLVAEATPISATTAAIATTDYINTVQDIPIWLSQGGLDVLPKQGTSDYVVSQMNNAGMDIRTVQPGEEELGPLSEGFYIVYPNLAHNTWDAFYNEPFVWQYMLRAYKSNPHVYFGRREFCPGTTLNVKLELTPGFNAYEWSRNGVIIAGANTNTITVTDTGTYAARIKDGSVWSDWSHWPAQITYKATTITPPIQVSGLMSAVIPAPDGNTSVTLTEPAGYASYEWRNSNGQVVGTDRTYSVTQPGKYIATVTEVYGCSAQPSDSFYVASSTGPNPPDAATNLSGFAISQTSIQLNWNNNAHPANNETAFEVYRATSSGGPYKMAGIVPADTLRFVDEELNANTKYFYIVRAVDSTSAAAVSAEDSVTTLVDRQAPSAPANLTVIRTTSNSTSLIWNSAVDNASIKNYSIYINGIRSYVTTDTTFTVYNLVHGQTYAIVVKATDPTGNVSVASNQVTATAVYKGLTYQYYTYDGSWSKLPDLGTLTPIGTGTSDNISLAPATQSTNYAFSWQGHINIRKAGTYTFYTSSDDGSNLYINNTLVVNNDGLHGTTEKSGTYTFDSVGIYPFRADYYQEGGSAVMSVSWKASDLNINKSVIPDSAFAESLLLAGSEPAIPTNITATALSYDSVKLSWSDNSSDETGFEIYRSTSSDGMYSIINTVKENAITYIDTSVSPSSTYFYKIQAINKYGASGFDLTSMGGLSYEYFESSNFSVMPDFTSITPIKSGNVPNVTLAFKNKSTDYAIKFSGSIRISESGQYAFYTKSDDGSNLYIDGFDAAHQVVNNAYLQGPTERSGVVDLNAGIHTIYITFFQHTGGDYLDASYKGPSIAKSLIPDSLFANGTNKAITPPMPPAPASPSNLVASSISSSAIALSWDDNSDNETGFKLYRSVGDSSNYLLLQTLPINTVSYKDSGLYANTSYYYKIAAENESGLSEYSSGAGAVTQDNPPQLLSPKGDQSIRFGTTTNISIETLDPDNEHLTLSIENLPSFGTFTDNGDGTGLISLSPSQGQEGSYPGIRVKVTDQHGEADSIAFTVNVTSSYQAPTINAQSSYAVVAGTSNTKTITAEYDDGQDALSWQVTNIPSFVTYQALNNGRELQLNINPSTTDIGNYILTLTVSNSDGSLSKQQTVTISVRGLQVININFNDGTNSQGGNWNNTDKKVPSLNDMFPNMIDTAGNNTSIGLKVLSSWQDMVTGSNNSGATTGNNSGIFPDNVMKSAYWTDNTKPQSIEVYGLDTSTTYSFMFFGSRAATGNRTTNYQIGGQTVSLQAANNTTNTVSISGVKPDSLGDVVITLTNGVGSTYGYLNAMVISGGLMPDKTAPASPSNLVASFNENNNKVDLNWEDRSINESGFEIYRGTGDPISYVKIGSVSQGIASFHDSTALGLTQYWYKVRSYNSYGYSEFVGPVGVTTPNTPPVIDPINDVTLSQGTVDTIAITTHTIPGNTIVLSISDLPAFAHFNDQGNGIGSLVLRPDNTVEGIYSLTITATDNNGGISSSQFSVSVNKGTVRTIDVNFNGTLNVAAPWNNTSISTPQSGTVVANLKDDNGKETGISLSFLEAWSGSNESGTVTGDDSGIYPDSVLETSYWDQSGMDRHVVLTGLSSAKRYSIAVLPSRSGAGNRMTIFAIGNTKDSLNASNNTDNTVRFADLSPDQDGEITITINRGSGSTYAYLNAMVITEYDSSLVLPATDVRAASTSSNTVNISWSNSSTGITSSEIWRALSVDGQYDLVGSTAGTVSSYVDQNLDPNTKYFYKIKSIKGSVSSDFSGIASATTSLYSIYVNLSDDNRAGMPWNDLNQVPLEGNSFSLYDAFGNNTGIMLNDMGGFAGVNHSGTTTGNNTGIYPDDVMDRSYYVDGVDTGRLVLTGLNLSMSYNITFFGGRTGTGDRTSIYMTDSSSVSLNASNNISQTVSIVNIMPDVNGEIHLSVTPGGSSSFAYLGAMVIEAHNNYDDSGKVIYSPSAYMVARKQLLGLNTSKIQGIENTNNQGFEILNTYPNPFSQYINIEMLSEFNQNVNISLFDGNGRLREQQSRPVEKGVNKILLEPKGELSQGVYILSIKSIKTGRMLNIKIIKLK